MAAFLVVAASCGSRGELVPQAAAAPGWIRLFNGRDLTGWTPKVRGYALGENVAGTFRVEDGLLKVVYDGYATFEGRYGHLFVDGSYSSYRLAVEYRFVGEQVPGGEGWAWRNSGVMIHGQDPRTMGLDQDFPDSIEVQLLGGDGTHPRPTANLCTPGTHVVIDGELVRKHCIDSWSPTYHGEDWVRVEVEVRSNERIEHFVEGESVLVYSRPQLDDGTPLYAGTISIQSEGHGIEFRRIDLLPLYGE